MIMDVERFGATTIHMKTQTHTGGIVQKELIHQMMVEEIKL
jgi:hypothetical protein